MTHFYFTIFRNSTHVWIDICFGYDSHRYDLSFRQTGYCKTFTNGKHKIHISDYHGDFKYEQIERIAQFIGTSGKLWDRLVSRDNEGHTPYRELDDYMSTPTDNTTPKQAPLPFDKRL